ncbi:hypothetical protein PENTCL1PPCAC_11898, partial [Pristionchus entomophagus]
DLSQTMLSSVKSEDVMGSSVAASSMLWPQLPATAATAFPPFMINDKGEMFAAAAAGGGPAVDAFSMGHFYPGQRWGPNPGDPFETWAAMNYNAFATATTGGQPTGYPCDPYPTTSMAGGGGGQGVAAAAAAA